MSKFLITGGTGYLGSRLIPMLLSEQHTVAVVKRTNSRLDKIAAFENYIDIIDSDFDSLENYFKKNKIDSIVHCATSYGRGDSDPASVVDANLIFPLVILKLAVKYGVETFYNTDTSIHKAVNSYALSKSQFKDWLILYSSRIKCVNILLEHYYGPGDGDDKFVSFIINDLLRKTPLIKLTPGEQKRDFIFIDDVVNAYRYILNKGNNDFSFIEYSVGSGTAVSIKAFIKMIVSMIPDCSTEILFGEIPYRNHEVMFSCADTAKLKLLGWECLNTLDEGLKKTISQDRENILQKFKDDI